MPGTILNFAGFLLKLGLIPMLLALFLEGDMRSFPSTTEFLGFFFLSGAGLMLLIFTEVILLRFGDGRSHFSRSPSRLVDVGMFARTRHPYHWYLSIYHFGIFTYFFGFGPLTIGLASAFFIIGLVFLILFQERFLEQALGERYVAYKSETPGWYWKLKIPERQKVMLLPQVVWVFGRVVFKRWYRIHVKGEQNIPHDKSFIIIANHESYIDPFLFGPFIPFEIQFVTTADVFTTPFMRFILKGVGTFPMRRHRQDLRSIRTMIRFIREGRTVCIFPEGGRSFDGTPLTIVDETIKLIQKCQVPILPVQLSGAYELWPRWAPNRRRTQIIADFKPMIPVEDQKDIKELRAHMQAAIFPTDREFTPTRSRFMVKGLDKFLWACVDCLTHDSIHTKSHDSIFCSNCGSEWRMDKTYDLVKETDKTSLSIIEWNRKIDSTIAGNPLGDSSEPFLATDEKPYLRAAIEGYDTDKGESLSNDLELVLTDKRFILVRSNEIFHSWDLDAVTVLTLDYAHAVSIGYGGVRHRFLLDPCDIPFKWRAYFQVLTGNVAN